MGRPERGKPRHRVCIVFPEGPTGVADAAETLRYATTPPYHAVEATAERAPDAGRDRSQAGARLLRCRAVPSWVWSRRGVDGRRRHRVRCARGPAGRHQLTEPSRGSIAPGTTRGEMMERWFDRHPGVEESLHQQAPLPRTAEPEGIAEAAEAAAWLCSDRASFVPEATVPVHGSRLRPSRT